MKFAMMPMFTSQTLCEITLVRLKYFIICAPHVVVGRLATLADRGIILSDDDVFSNRILFPPFGVTKDTILH